MKLYFPLILLLVGCSVLTLTTGEIHFDSVWEGIKGRWYQSSNDWNPLLDERLPRLIVILCTGASLAVSGVIMRERRHRTHTATRY